MGPSGVGFDGRVGGGGSNEGDQHVEPEEAATCIVEEEIFSHGAYIIYTGGEYQWSVSYTENSRWRLNAERDDPP